MENSFLLNKNYKSISSQELEVLRATEKTGLVVFGATELQRITKISTHRLSEIFSSLEKKGFLIKLLRNQYCKAQTAIENPYLVATNTFIPSYISFWTALSFYGFTEQQVKTIQVASPKQFKKIQNKQITIQPITVKKENFFGYTKETGFAIASKEKAILDSALNFELAGGFSEFKKSFKNAWPELNEKTIFKYLFKLENKSLNSRIGFLIETLNLKVNKKLLEKLEKNKSKGFIKLDPKAKKTSNYNKKWKIGINEKREEEII
ncbi:MAG: hypothetical protein COV47_01150 [Candidatus Diapherotrites archaeon CG11_big_fil_rev_8_21_14_0_20_37_9]|nr:MAG: hypothetical protein COV47_01150 [Candidatus Diapherotrites archaeon CG11_big_fil_rev_8_21_14_0_20_37_9]